MRNTQDFLMLGKKRRMIGQLREKGITDESVLSAFEKVDRHLFLESVLWPNAYDDVALTIATDQTISRPSTVAFQTQLLEVVGGMKVLEIGTGSGFQAAILNAMGTKVFSIERQITLFKKTSNILNKVAPNVITIYGDGFAGLPRFAPFDRIIVTCGAPNIPDNLLNQLKVGGIMVIPVGVDSQIMKKIKKVSDSEFEEEDFGDFIFVPMLKDRVKKS